MKTKRMSSADKAEFQLVYDKPITLQRQIPNTDEWEDVQHLHANVNNVSGGTSKFTAENVNVLSRLLFRLRYFPLLDAVRNAPEKFRIEYMNEHYEVINFDDYNERRHVIKITADRYELPIEITVYNPTYEKRLGAAVKNYPENGCTIKSTWENTGTQEVNVKGIVSVTETAKITVRKTALITSDSRIERSDGTMWEIIGVPNNTAYSERWAVFTVRRISGGA